MKAISISSPSADVAALLSEAREEDVLVRTPDGTEFMVSVVDEFDREIACTRRNAKLMAFLDERGKQERTLSLGEVKRELGL